MSDLVKCPKLSVITRRVGNGGIYEGNILVERVRFWNSFIGKSIPDCVMDNVY